MTYRARLIDRCRRKTAAVLLPIAPLLLIAIAGCSNGSSHLPSLSGSPATSVTSGGPISDGDPCASDGAKTDCGTVVDQLPDAVVCALGSRTCHNGVWGSCVPNGQRHVQSRPVSIQTVGTTSKCTWDPCDPYCQQILDTPPAVVPSPDAGYTVDDGGVILERTKIGANGSTTCTGLSVTASSATISVTALSPVTTTPTQVTFSANLLPAGCYPTTTPVLWTLDRTDIATIDSSGHLVLVSPLAVPIKVTGYSGAFQNSLTVQVSVNILNTSKRPSGISASSFDPSLPTNPDTLSLLYPYAQTVFPLGLAPPLLQWATGAVGAASAVKISLRYPATGASQFNWSAIIPESSTMWLDPPNNTIPLAAGPRAAIDGIDQSIWPIFERTAQGNDAAIVLQRLTGATLRQELATTVHFANGQLKGTVYYHSYGTLLVNNYGNTYGTQTYGAGQQFGAATLAIQPGASGPVVAAGYASATSAPTDATSGCHVCHSGSANGNVLVTNLLTNTNSILYKLGTDAANGGTYLPTGSTGAFSWGAVYPDGTYLFSNSGPTSNYSSSTPPPGGLEGSDSGSLGNALYSLNPGPTFGTVVTTTGIPSALRAALPTFSPDGSYVAFNHYDGTVGLDVGDKRSLGMMSFNVSTKTFSNFRRLFTEPASACNAAFSADPCTSVWPSFFPDSSAVVFEREVFNDGRVTGANHADFGGTRSGCDDSSGSAACGNDGTKAQLWWVTTGNTPSTARLSAANGCNASGNATIPVSGVSSHTATIEPVLNYEPTVSPQAAGGFNWVAFTSRRTYGNVATINPWWSDPRFRPIGGQFGPTTKKIWVSALDGNPTAGTDPSHPAFYLPGQELLAGNAKAFWALENCTNASATKSAASLCDTNLDCCGATGSSPTSICALDTPLTNPAVRHCLPLSISGACIADNSTTPCVTDAQCCNATAVNPSLCVNGTCQPPPPITIYKQAQFTRDFAATCPAGQSAIWREVQWKGSIPTSGSIDFLVQTATTEAGLATSPSPSTPLLVTSATTADYVAFTTSSKAVAQVFNDADVLPQVYLRLTIRLNPSSDKLSTPILTAWRQLFDCIDSQ